MRELEFRGLDINGEEWHYGLLAVMKKGWFISNSAGSSPFAYQVKPETVGQYIGIKDIDKVKIYEGDCVASRKKDIIHEIIYREDHARFMFKDFICNINMYQEAIDEHGFKVAGNVHQNPELAKENKKIRMKTWKEHNNKFRI